MDIIKFTLRMPKETKKIIEKAATDSNLTLTDYLLASADPSYLKNNKVLQIEDVLKKVDLVPKGDLFTIKSLYTTEQWVNFSHGSRIATSRLFGTSLRDNINNFQSEFEFVGKSTLNLAAYKKIN